MAGTSWLWCALLLTAEVSWGKVYFSETFDDTWASRWTLSKWKDSEKEKMGKWVLSAGRFFRDPSEDQGIQTAEIMKFYGVAAAFEPFSNEGKELIIQYQVKYEKDLGCGGGYLKVGPSKEDLASFGEPTPYHIMFGPDQCNTDKRTHLIFSYQGKNYLKKSELPYKQEGEGISHLYRLHLKPDSSVRVEVDGEQIYEGSLKDDWDMLPASRIPDPSDHKPEDWVEQEKIEDPTDMKPTDWAQQAQIVDSHATKPEEWDDEEDGDWEPPMVDNPAFKGTWSPRMIANPAYRGKWEARMVPNPAFVDKPDLYKYDDFGYVGIDVWQVKGGTIFDNIILTDSITEADEFAAKWKVLREAEMAEMTKAEEAQREAFEKAKASRAARAAAKKAEEGAKASKKGKSESGKADGPGTSEEL
ncbi:crt-1 [Symbiodinium natans]|uniref:Calreticulin n=1 Tax=Symbiodinium natans TaxID=878477 RepID=A0A812SZ17_9DINO|nr:crt-1 [Symbiodinium natans]